jgi:type II restriction enzyme
MVNGFNALFHDKKKLGSWQSYLEMREVIVQTNNEVRDQLSKDLSRCSEFLSYFREIGLSLIDKETKSRGSFQTDIPSLHTATRDRAKRYEGSLR